MIKEISCATSVFVMHFANIFFSHRVLNNVFMQFMAEWCPTYLKSPPKSGIYNVTFETTDGSRFVWSARFTKDQTWKLLNNFGFSTQKTFYGHKHGRVIAWSNQSFCLYQYDVSVNNLYKTDNILDLTV